MNIKIPKTKQIVSLNESEIEQIQKIDFDNEKTVLRLKSKQFIFENGIIMANINQKIDNRFGLIWHFDNTNDFNEFLTSVRTYVELSEEGITESDTERLKKQYNNKASKNNKI